ncbi:hypothetical protein L083_3870 [Actinoplanes sp. N902-109]|nr:hypothetical protein L083_3870 [Actinoplanes sp. N902-109]
MSSPSAPAARPLLGCGIAVDQRDLLNLFKHVYLVTCDHETASVMDSPGS